MARFERKVATTARELRAEGPGGPVAGSRAVAGAAAGDGLGFLSPLHQDGEGSPTAARALAIDLGSTSGAPGGVPKPPIRLSARKAVGSPESSVLKVMVLLPLWNPVLMVKGWIAAKLQPEQPVRLTPVCSWL
jgi:hypothetical protein